jgi:hypothetical protein
MVEHRDVLAQAVEDVPKDRETPLRLEAAVRHLAGLSVFHQSTFLDLE